MIQNALIVFVAGGTGCLARYLLTLVIPRIDSLPLGVLAVNLIGSFAAGLFFGGILPLLPRTANRFSGHGWVSWRLYHPLCL